jgi:hypothetical protein
MSQLFKLNIEDLLKGLILTVLTSVVTVIYNTVNAGSLTFDWHSIGITAITSGLAYLLKNYLTNSKGEFASRETNRL